MSKDPERVSNFRTSNVAVFALFEINKTDAAALYSVIDNANIQDCVKDFANKYCGTSKDLFLLLWDKYYTGIYNKERLNVKQPKFPWLKSKKYAVSVKSFNTEDMLLLDTPTGTTTAPEEPEVEVPPPAPHHIKPILSTSYVEFLCFLLFFMSVKDIDIVRWAYWLFFYLYDIDPVHRDFYELVDILWGTNEKTKFKRNRCKTKVENVMKHVEVDEICPKKIKIVDIQSNGAWSKPLLALRKILITSTLGSSTWNRIGECVRFCSENVNENYNKLKDTHHWSEWGEDNPILRGDRRAARKNIRQFLRVYKKYLTMPDDTDDGPQEELSLTGIGSSIFQSIGQFVVGKFMKPKVNPDEENNNTSNPGSPVGSPSMKLRNELKAKKALSGKWGISFRAPIETVDEDVDDKDAAIPLEVRYADSLTAPLSELYGNVHRTQDRVKVMLAQCSDEFNMSREDFMERYQQQQKEAELQALKARGRISRQVVVDVSSSSSSSSSGSGSRSGSASETEEYSSKRNTVTQGEESESGDDN